VTVDFAGDLLDPGEGLNIDGLGGVGVWPWNPPDTTRTLCTSTATFCGGTVTTDVTLDTDLICSGDDITVIADGVELDRTASLQNLRITQNTEAGVRVAAATGYIP
jgi:hypothetical protein